jgi:hypothetical protein
VVRWPVLPVPVIRETGTPLGITLIGGRLGQNVPEDLINPPALLAGPRLPLFTRHQPSLPRRGV